MRNKYTIEFEQNMYKIASMKTLDELLKYVKRKYKYKITKHQLRLYLSKRKIRYKDFDYDRCKRTRNQGDNVPIGTERIKSDGMVQVKIAKDRWEYKQRIIYSQYHNIELTNNDYIIFLDQDRTNFDINNLERVSRRESAIVANEKLFFKNSNLTKAGIEVAKLIIKIKDKERENETSNNNKKRNNIRKRVGC